jgi:hypothetical protein
VNVANDPHLSGSGIRQNEYQDTSDNPLLHTISMREREENTPLEEGNNLAQP